MLRLSGPEIAARLNKNHVILFLPVIQGFNWDLLAAIIQEKVGKSYEVG